jgi:hypothetical protein
MKQPRVLCPPCPSTDTPHHLHYSYQMCYRNYMRCFYPGLRILFDNFEPCTLCDRAQHYPIGRPCGRVHSQPIPQEREFCLDCLFAKHGKVGLEEKTVGNERLPNGSRWSVHGGSDGREVWKEDVPQ